MDMVEAAGTGHVGTALSLAPLLHLLYARYLNVDPDNPTWRDRDRFVLSSGHAAASLYAVLHLRGYAVTVDDLRAFRAADSDTPGHPELGRTPGVDATTGALGQGFGAAVGMALAEQTLKAARDQDISHRTVVVAGDGDLQEGLSHESAALAGLWRLSKLACVYNSNDITLDGAASLSQADDVAARFTGYGWRVMTFDNSDDDLYGLVAALEWLFSQSDRPSLLIMRTVIASPAPTLKGQHVTHGQPLGIEEVRATKLAIGLPPDEDFFIDPAILNLYRGRPSAITTGGSVSSVVASYEPVQLRHIWAQLSNQLVSPRDASQRCLESIAAQRGNVVAGAADITRGTGTLLKGDPRRAVRQVVFGIREHGMAAALHGVAVHGGLLPVGGTYLVFSDYLRPALRTAGLDHAPLVLCLTHDGFDTAEDGPTHHAFEHLAALRVIPGLTVIRPADAREVCEAWEFALDHRGPVALVLSREPVGRVPRWPAATGLKSGAVATGAYVVAETAAPDVTLIGTGVEVHLALDSAAALHTQGVRARVASMPCWELFESQPAIYRDHVIPPSVPAVVVEAGVPFGWAHRATPVIPTLHRYTSASAAVLRELNGLTVEQVSASVIQLLHKQFVQTRQGLMS